MEFDSTVRFLENKSILVSGAAGFLAKIVVEKILRVQPNVKKLYLLLRAKDEQSANLRLKNEIVGKELFQVLKDKLGANFDSFIAEKITLVPGDICYDGLGVQDPSLMEEMCHEVSVVVNSAATTNFDERYDVSLDINTLGAKHILSFAKKCEKIMVVVHVSTAYVSGERAGLIKEEPFYMGETLNGVSSLDIDVELKIAEDALKDLRAKGLSDPEITLAMKDLGIARARKHGWPNTYVFTKAMGEMLVGKLKENMSVVILRPTIVTSTFKEPFPGWVEGVRTIDSLAIGYGKGRLICFLGDPNSTIDGIPADMVVNSILVSMAANANIPSETIYQVGSSLKNPLKYSDIQDTAFKYFTSKPWINKDGTPVIVGKVKVMRSMSSFHRYMAFRYLFFLKGLEFANTALCQMLHGPYTDMNKKICYVMRMVELYQPYLFFKGIYDDNNLEKLRKAASSIEDEGDVFYFDPKAINWDDYFVNIHFPGLVKYVFKYY